MAKKTLNESMFIFSRSFWNMRTQDGVDKFIKNTNSYVMPLYILKKYVMLKIIKRGRKFKKI